jgi:hypothetical protein
MDPESSFPHLPVRHLSLFWARSIQSMPHIPSPEGLSEYYSPIYTWVFQVVYIPQVSTPKSCIHLSSLTYVLHVPLMSLFSIWSPE